MGIHRRRHYVSAFREQRAVLKKDREIYSEGEMTMGVGMQCGLEGKNAIVTGSSRGLGRDVALELARQGASVILADIRDLDETAGEIAKIGGRCLPVQTDVSNEQSVKTMAETAASEFGHIDILVNNAGIAQGGVVATVDCPIEEWDRVIQVNLRGVFLCSKYIGKNMIGQGGGSIINIASTAGYIGIPRAAAYCASKAGVILLTKTLAVEWARYNVRVNAIAPHYLETELTKGVQSSEQVYESLVKQIPMRRFGRTDEIVPTLLLLSSSLASYVTGSIFVVDGGFLAQ
jgi:NAD(P)-dependent dehydrogenase (short-subunit alcohol dehydrogenase family)